MSRLLRVVSAWFVAASLFVGSLITDHRPLITDVWAAVPWVINYQGRLTDSTSTAITGSYTLTFRLYNAATSGTKQWEEQQTVSLTTSDNGIFNVVLGAVTVLTSVDFNMPMWLSIQVADDTEMTPRQRLTAVGYAMNADQVDGLDSTKFLRTDVNTSTSGKLTITNAGTALVITPATDPAANTKLIDVQNAAGTSKFSVDLEGDVAVAGDLTVTGTVSGSIATTGTTSASWTVGSGTDATANDLSLLFGQSSGQESIIFDGNGTDDFAVSDDLRLSTQATLRLEDDSGGDYVALKAPTGVTTYTVTLPAAVATVANQALTSDTSGNLSWTTVSSLSGVGDITSVTAGTGLTGGGTSGDVTLTLSTPVSVANGGTGAATLTANGVLYGNTTSAIGATSAGTTGTVLHGNTGSAPSFSAVSLTADVSGILPLANGGTNAALGNCTSGQALTVTGGVVACTSTITASTAAADSLDFTEFKDAMALDANTTIDLGGFDLILDDMSSTDTLQLQNAQASADTATFYVADTATSPAADLVISASDGGVLIDTLGAADLAASGGSPALDNRTDISDSLAIASSPTAADSDGVIKLGRDASEWEYIWYDNSARSGAGEFVFSASTRVESSSPAYLLFSPPKGPAGTAVGSRYGIKFDPEVTPKTISFVEITNPTTTPIENTLFEMKAGGRMGLEFVNVVRNGSFEAFSALETFGNSTATCPAGGCGGAGQFFQGGWSNFSPDEWVWVAGKVFQHAPLLFMPSTTITATNLQQDFYHGKSAVALQDTSTSVVYTATDDSTIGSTITNDAAIKQVVKNLKPSTSYSIGVKALANDVGPTSNSTAAKVNITGEDASGQLTPMGQSTAGELSTTSSTFTDLVGTFKTNSTAGDITVYLICQQTGTLDTEDVCRFDAVQVVASKSLPDFAPNALVDTGDQTVYGSIRMGRTADDRGGILSVDKSVRTRAIEFFEKDPGMSGTSGGFGGIGSATKIGIGSGSTLTTLSTGGTFFGSNPRDILVTVTPTSSVFKWEYRECSPSTGCLGTYQLGGSGLNISNYGSLTSASNPLPGSMGVNIAFGSGTAAVNDQWSFGVAGMNMAAQYNSYSGTATYQPGNTRIFKDPFSQKLTFQDGTTTVTLDQIAGSGIGSPARVDWPMFFPSSTGGGQISLDVLDGNLFSGSQQTTFEIEICSTSGPTRDQYRWRDNIANGGGAAADWDSACTEIPASGGPFGPPQIPGGGGATYGFRLKFNSPAGTWVDGNAGDRWQMTAFPPTSSSAIKTLTGNPPITVTGTGDSRTIDLSGVGCSAGFIWKRNGTNSGWECVADSGGGGTVTSVSAGTGLAATPSPITTSGALAFDYSATLVGSPTLANNQTTFASTGIIFEGATGGAANANEGLLTVVDPTADQTWTLPDVSGTLITTGDTGTVATAMIANNAVTGAKIAMGSDVSGDTLYYNGTDYVRLAKGTDGQVLKLTAGLPSWAADSTGGSPSFDTITGGTNTTAAMVVGTGASLGVSGTGTITATDLVAGSSVVADAEVDNDLTLASTKAGSFKPATDVVPLTLQRGTDTSPAANLLTIRNAANAADLFAISAAGAITTGTLPLSSVTGQGNLDLDSTNDLTTATAAGGDLTGTYPNPTIAANAVTSTKIAAASMTKAKLAEMAPSAQGTPDKTVAIAAGKVYVSGNTLVDFVAANANFAAAGNCAYTPTATAKYLKALITLTSSNTLACTFGTEQNTTGAAESTALTYPTDKLAIVEVILETIGTAAGDIDSIEATAGTKSYLYADVRPFLNVGTSAVAAYATVKDETTALTQRSTIAFLGSGVSCADANSQTECTIAGGGGGDILSTGTNIFTSPNASPVLLRPGSAPVANTKLFDVQTSGTTTSVASLDAEGDAILNSLTLTTALTDANVNDTLTASLFVGSGSTTTAVDLATTEVAGTLADANVADDLTIASTKNGSFTGGATTGDLFSVTGASLTSGTLLKGVVPSASFTGSLLKITDNAGTPATKFAIDSAGAITTGTIAVTGITGTLTDAQVSDTLTASLFVGSGSTTTAVDLATAEVAGTLTVNKGGSGATTLTGIVLGNGTSAFTTITDNSANWDTAYTDRLKWDGGATGLVAATGRTSLGLGTIATQNANAVAITGGAVDGTTVGATTAAAGKFTTLESTDNLSVATDKKVNLEGSAGDTYLSYDSTKGKLFVYVNNAKVAWFKD